MWKKWIFKIRWRKGLLNTDCIFNLWSRSVYLLLICFPRKAPAQFETGFVLLFNWFFATDCWQGHIYSVVTCHCVMYIYYYVPWFFVNISNWFKDKRVVLITNNLASNGTSCALFLFHCLSTSSLKSLVESRHYGFLCLQIITVTLSKPIRWIGHFTILTFLPYGLGCRKFTCIFYSCLTLTIFFVSDEKYITWISISSIRMSSKHFFFLKLFYLHHFLCLMFVQAKISAML